jgi:hypothetical protein
MVIIFLLLRQPLLSTPISEKNNSSGLGRVPEMAATFHGPDQRHQHQVEEDRQREKGVSPVTVPGQQQHEVKEEKKFRSR